MLEKLWYMSFRCVDDIKDTVREAGHKAVRSAISLTLRLVDPQRSRSEECEEILGIVLPFLLEKGIQDPCKDVQVLSVRAIVRIVRFAKDAVQPYLTQVITVLLESLSSLEPQVCVLKNFKFGLFS